MLQQCSLIDSFRHLHPTTVAYTSRSTYPQWTGGHRFTEKRIDLIASVLPPYSASTDTISYCFTDHAAVSVSYHLPPLPPITKRENEKEKKGAGETQNNLIQYVN